MIEPRCNTPTDLLIEMLEQQQALVVQLGTLAERQGPLIEAGDSDGLLTLLARRQEVMDRFVSSQDELTRLSDDCRNAGSAVDQATRQRIKSLVDEISERLSVVMQRDDRDRERLETVRRETGDALSGLSTARAAHDAYVKVHVVNNRFADRQG